MTWKPVFFIKKKSSKSSVGSFYTLSLGPKNHPWRNMRFPRPRWCRWERPVCQVKGWESVATTRPTIGWWTKNLGEKHPPKWMVYKKQWKTHIQNGWFWGEDPYFLENTHMTHMYIVVDSGMTQQKKNPIQASEFCVICPEYIMAVVIDIHSLS